MVPQNRQTFYIFGGVLVFSAIHEIYFLLTYSDPGQSMLVFLAGMGLILLAFLILTIVQLILCKKEGRSFSSAFIVILATTMASFIIYLFDWYVIGLIFNYLTGNI